MVGKPSIFGTCIFFNKFMPGKLHRGDKGSLAFGWCGPRSGLSSNTPLGELGGGAGLLTLRRKPTLQTTYEAPMAVAEQEDCYGPHLGYALARTEIGGDVSD